MTTVEEIVDKCQGVAVTNGRTVDSGSNLFIEWFTKEYEAQDIHIRMEAMNSRVTRYGQPSFILEVKHKNEIVLKARANYNILGPTNIKTETYVSGTWEQRMFDN